jgi:hypothetical protein
MLFENPVIMRKIAEPRDRRAAGDIAASQQAADGELDSQPRDVLQNRPAGGAAELLGVGPVR